MESLFVEAFGKLNRPLVTFFEEVSINFNVFYSVMLDLIMSLHLLQPCCHNTRKVLLFQTISIPLVAFVTTKFPKHPRPQLYVLPPCLITLSFWLLQVSSYKCIEIICRFFVIQRLYLIHIRKRFYLKVTVSEKRQTFPWSTLQILQM